MKKSPLLLLLILFFFEGFAQVGIGTASPAASAILDVTATDKGVLLSRMTSVQRIAIASPAMGLMVFDIDTKSLWYYNGSFWVNSETSAKYGDVKTGIQASDHDGWLKLDGRTISGLSATQRAVALSLLGSTATLLPNATEAYAVQKSGTLGSVSGSNTVSITQANLPLVSFTGSAASNGSHSHNVDPLMAYTNTTGNHQHFTSFNNDDYNGGGGGNQSLEDDGGGWSNRYTSWAGDHYHSVDIPNTASTTNGDHGHNVTVSSGGSGTALNIAPKSLIVNMFIYLGF